jgi:diguanylate cyclase (GGDEF)-like protein
MPPKIFIADDDQENLDLLKFIFESEHYNVITASDGEQAIHMVKKEMPDLVILDVNMPKVSGFEVCEAIRQDGATCLIPIIMLTSLSKTKDLITGIKLGADEYLKKPFETFELVARVEGLLKRTKASIAANPLTCLPGNISIETEIKKRLEDFKDFAVAYIDVDNFKSFNDKYGFERGDKVIRLISVILKSAVSELGNNDDFIGNLGGEDFVIVTTPEKIEAVAKKITAGFDALVPQQYDEDVRSRGYLWGINRQGQEVQFPIMTISIGALLVKAKSFRDYSQIVEQSKNLLKQAKLDKKSSYVIA